MTNFIPITKTRYAQFCEGVRRDLPEDTAARVITEFTSAANYDPTWSRSSSDPDFWRRVYERKLENAKRQGLTYYKAYVKSPGVKKTKK